MNIEQARFNMVEQQIRPWNVQDSAVLSLLSEVHREDFVPASDKALAFADLEISLPCGQCMLAPRLTARMLQDANVQPQDKVLEIGAGSGYMAALLAKRARHVTSVDIHPELVELARSNLQKAGIGNVQVQLADGSKMSPLDAPFDVIILSGSVAQIPHDLLQHLSIGGRLVAIVGDEPVMHATIVKRTSPSNFVTTTPWDTVAQRLENFAEVSRFHF